MGKHLLFVLFCIVPQFSFSQNWSVINMTDKFNYRLDGDPVITTTIWADSVHWNGSDSVFYLNRVMCDTCATILGGPDPCDTCYGLKNQPQFLQRECFVSLSGVVNFRDTANIVIPTQATLNDYWIYDSTLAMVSIVSAVGTDSVFGSIDSIKTILLLSGDTVKLSKNYGLLQFPNGYGMNSYYRLVGIEGRNLGERVPKYADFFNFDVGDMFEYHGIYSYTGSLHCFSDEACEYIDKVTITSKTQLGDTVLYGFTSIGKEVCWHLSSPTPPPPCTSYGAMSGFKRYVDTSGNWLNQTYQQQALKLENLNGYAGLPCGTNDSAYDFLKTQVDSNGVFIKYFGFTNPECRTNIISCNYVFESAIQHASDTLFPYTNWVYAEAAGVGLGIIHYRQDACFEGGKSESLVAYRKGNDTVGVFTPDVVLSSISEMEEFSKQVNVFPNPGNDKIQIVFPYTIYSEISLYDLKGKNLMKSEMKGESLELSISHIENGLYFLTFRMHEGSFTRKIIIMH